MSQTEARGLGVVPLLCQKLGVGSLQGAETWVKKLTLAKGNAWSANNRQQYSSSWGNECLSVTGKIWMAYCTVHSVWSKISASHGMLPGLLFLLLFTCLIILTCVLTFPGDVSYLSSNVYWRRVRGQFLICVSSSKRGEGECQGRDYGLSELTPISSLEKF